MSPCVRAAKGMNCAYSLRDMQKYRVMIQGENVLVEFEGVRQKFGFFTNVFVEAFTEADAEARAIEIVREDAALADILLNEDDDPLSLSAEEIQEIDSFARPATRSIHALPNDRIVRRVGLPWSYNPRVWGRLSLSTL